jgi:hypothetical protein
LGQFQRALQEVPRGHVNHAVGEKFLDLLGSLMIRAPIAIKAKEIKRGVTHDVWELSVGTRRGKKEFIKSVGDFI